MSATKSILKKAVGSVTERATAIFTWLQENHPSALDHFNGPAEEDAIAIAEAALGVELPDEYKQFMAMHNGQVSLSPFVGLGWLLPLEQVVKEDEDIIGKDMPNDSEYVGKGVRAVDFSPRWIPITKSARGRDYYCIDLDPAAGGVAGQIIEYIVDDHARPLIAASFADLLSLYFDGIQSGEIDLDLGQSGDDD